MKTSLQSLPQKKVTTGFAKLQQAGVTPHMWLSMLDADEAAMERLVAAGPRQPGAYDAVALPGFGEPSGEALPDAAAGEIVLRYGGWSLRELCEGEVGTNLMHRQDWYDRYEWSGRKLPAGIYRLRLPVPDSNHKTFAEQQTLLLPGEESAPVVIAATALLCHRLQAGEDLLRGDWARCKEQAGGGCRAELRWLDGRLGVGVSWGGNRLAFMWLASARASS